MLAGLRFVGRELDPAGLAASADQHLGLDDHRIADLVGRGYGVLYGRDGLAGRDLKPVAGEQLLALILKKVHWRRGTLTKSACRGAAGPAAPPDASTGHNAGPMAIPKNVTFVTFDVYGTLIDWETGIYEAFAKEAARDGFTIDRGVLIPLFHEVSRELEAGSYELYAEVLRRTAVEISKRMEWELEPSRSGFLPDSVQRWAPFKETNIQLQKLAKKYKLGLISNIDDKLLGQTRRHIPHDFDLVVTAQQVRSYKPEPAHFVECARRMGGKKGWVHIASSHHHDVAPCIKQRVPVIWVNRNKETLDSSQKKPTVEVPNLREAAKLLGAA